MTGRRGDGIRTLHICFSKTIGPLEERLIAWNFLLQEQGHETLNIVSPQSALSETLHQKALFFEPWSPPPSFSPRASLKLRSFLQDMNVHDIYLYGVPESQWLGPALWGLPDLRIFLCTDQFHGPPASFFDKSWKQRLQGVVVFTGLQKKFLRQELAIGIEKLHVIPQAVPTKRYAPRYRGVQNRARMGYAPTDFVVGNFCRPTPKNAQLLLLQAFRDLRQQFLNAKLLLRTAPKDGTPEMKAYHQKCVDFVKKSRLENDVKWLKASDSLHKLYANLDLYVLPSSAPFGFELLKPMASGTPVLAANGRSVPELLGDGQYGWLCPPKNSEQLTKVMLTIVSDQELRHRKSSKALEHIQTRYAQASVSQAVARVWHKR